MYENYYLSISLLFNALPSGFSLLQRYAEP